jgi:hypothetical protein
MCTVRDNIEDYGKNKSFSPSVHSEVEFTSNWICTAYDSMKDHRNNELFLKIDYSTVEFASK